MSPTAHSTPLVSVHRWPWRRQEFISMSVAFALTFGFGYFIYSLRPTLGTLWLVGSGAAALGSVYWLYRTKTKRVNTSQVTVTILGSVVRSESAGPLGKTQADVARATTVSYRRFGSDETFMISDADGNTVRIPLRATKDPDVQRLVAAALTRAEHIAVDASSLGEKMNAGPLPY